MSAKADLITMESNKGKQLKTSFSYSQNVKKKYIFGYLRGPGGGGAFYDKTWAYLAFQLSKPIYMYM